MDDFRKAILKVNGPRVHKVRNSWGIYDAYKYIRKNKWLDIGIPLTEHQFYHIVRVINDSFADNLISGHDIIFPCKMGKLEVRKYDARITFNNGKVKTNLPIDWDRTLQLWSEDEETYKERTLIKMEEKEIFKVYYNRIKADYNNKSLYEFSVNRDLKRRLNKRIKSGNFDAFKL
jgi:hypothetical protein